MMKKQILRQLIFILIGVTFLALSVGLFAFFGGNKATSRLYSEINTPVLRGRYAEGDFDGVEDVVAGDSFEGGGDDFSSPYEYSTTYTAYKSVATVSIDGDYLLVLTGIDNVTNYKALGLSIKENGVEKVGADFDQTIYYTGVTARTGDTTVDSEGVEVPITKTYSVQDFYPNASRVAGLIAYEVPYDANNVYRIQASLQKNDGTTLYGSIRTTKEYDVRLYAPTSTAYGSSIYTCGNLDTFKLAIAKNTVTNLSLVEHSYKTVDYSLGDSFDATGMLLRATYANGDIYDVVVADHAEVEYKRGELSGYEGAIDVTFDGQTVVESIAWKNRRNYRFEAEEAEFTGAVATEACTDVLRADDTQEMCVRSMFDAADKSITFKIHSDVAQKVFVQLHISDYDFENENLDDFAKFTVNETIIPTGIKYDTSVEAYGNEGSYKYWYFRKYQITGTVQLQAGENVITLSCSSASGGGKNINCMELIAENNVIFTKDAFNPDGDYGDLDDEE